MCGIAGIIYKDANRVIEKDIINQMTRTLIHRGPDDEGFFIDKNVALGHRRLSIIDLTSGHQPIFNENKTICIVFNGEIYNYKNLQSDLLSKGHKFTTNSDTEVILHAYEEYGPDCVDKLRGMFAFVIWDKRINSLMLARDRVGKKPLYYYEDDSVFLVASEVKAIFKSGLIKPRVNLPILDFYLSLGYTPGRETLFKGINKIEPGYYILVNNNFEKTFRQYWDVPINRRLNIGFREACETLKKILRESIELRLISDVPLGAFLSGGLDSSIIVALMSEIQSQPVKTFSVGYSDAPDLSELKFARAIAERFHTDHHEFILTSEDLFDSIDTFLEHTEEPIVESAGIALYKLAKLAKPHATVLLSGEGSDEIFAGYPLYHKMDCIEKLYFWIRLLPPDAKNILLKMFASDEKTEKYIEWLFLPFEKRYRSVSYDLAGITKRKMYTDELKSNLNGVFEEYFQNLHNRVDGKSLLTKMLYIDIKSWLTEDILTKSDRMTMAASVEMRCPFLDQNLIEFVLSLSDVFKLRNGIGKVILREIMKDILPSVTLKRKKMGFPVPLSFWFKGELFEKAQKLLLDNRTLERKYFKVEYIKGLFKNIRKNEDLGRRIFALVTLELWHRKYIDY